MMKKQCFSFVKRCCCLWIMAAMWCNGQGAMAQVDRDSIALADTLSEVVVTERYQRTLRNGDIQMLLQGNPIAKGKTLLETLQFVRGVQVSDKNEIRVQGNAKVVLFIDGRKVSAEELERLSSEMVSRIVVSPQSAPRDHNPNGSTIRVYLKKQAGIMGSISLHEYATNDKTNTFKPSATFLYNRGKHTFYVQPFYTLNQYHIKEMREDYHTIKQYRENTNIITRGKGHNAGANLSYKLDLAKAGTLSFYSYISGTPHKKYDTDSNSETSAMKTHFSQHTLSLRNGADYEVDFGADNQHSFQINTEFSFDKEKETNLYSLKSSTETFYKMYDRGFSVDPSISFELPYKNSLSLSASVDYSKNIFDLASEKSSDLVALRSERYSRNYSGYMGTLEYAQEPTDRFYYEITLIGRYTIENYINYLDPNASKKYTFKSFLPSIYARWRFNTEKNGLISLRYNYVRSNSNYFYYSPVVSYKSEKLYGVGNPNLNQERYHILSLGCNWGSCWSFRWSTDLFKDVVELMTYADASRPNGFIQRPENIGRIFRQRLELYYNTDVAKKFYTNNGATYSFMKETAPNRKLCYSNFSFFSYNQYLVNSHLSFGLNAELLTGTASLSHKTSFSYAVSPKISLYLLKNKLNISKSFQNLFYASAKKIVTDPHFKMTYRDLTQRRGVVVKLIWNFSAGKKMQGENFNHQFDNDKLRPVL